MKLRNIVAMISFLIAAVSCSMEDDVLNEITKSETPNNNSNQTEVYLSVNAIVNSVNTKAYTDPTIGTEADLSVIEDCSVILFENDKVIGAYHKSGVTPHKATENGPVLGYNLNDARFLVKTGRNYEVYVIANTAHTFSGYSTKGEVESAFFNNTDLTNKVKFGSEPVYISTGSSSAITGTPETTIEVELKNLTAQVRLMDVLYSGFANGTNETTVVLEKVEFLNQNIKYNIAGTAAMSLVKENVLSWDNNGAGYEVEKRTAENTYEDQILCNFPTFPNVSNVEADQVALKLTFKVGSRYEYRTYVINRQTGEDGMTNNAVDKEGSDAKAYVNAGFIYQLYATVAVTGDTFNCTIKCCTKDWVLNTYEVTMTEL